MKKKLLILFTLVMVLSIALSITATCFAEDFVEQEIEIKPIEVELDDPLAETEDVTADNDAWTWIKETWEKVKGIVLGAVSGISFSAIVAAIVCVVVKRLTNKVADKVEANTNSTTIADLTSQKVADHFSKTTIDVNIQPLMEKQYLILANQVYDTLFKSMQKQDEKYLAMVKCFEKLSHYYDGSIGVTDAQKEELAEAIAYAESLFVEPTKTTAKIAVVAEEPKQEETKVITRNY